MLSNLEIIENFHGNRNWNCLGHFEKLWRRLKVWVLAGLNRFRVKWRPDYREMTGGMCFLQAHASRVAGLAQKKLGEDWIFYQVGKGMSRDFCHKKCMGRGQPRDCAMKKWRLFDRGQRWFPWAERRAGLSSAYLNTGCETCAHARGCEQMLLSSNFRFCCLALSSSVFVAFNCVKCWVREHSFWGVQTPHSGRAPNAWHSPREGSIVCRQLHVLRQNPATRMSLAD